jgi:ribosomal-protein-alanine N-acetyltransferase
MELFDPFPMLETPRLLLRETTMADAPEVQFLRSDAVMLRFLKKEPMQHIDEVKAFVASLRTKRLAGESIEWCVTARPAGRMIGSVCLWNFSADRRKGELGYLLHPDHWKQGLMSEAVSAVLAFGFGTLRLALIEAYTHRENHASLRMLKQHGFAETGRTDPDNSDNVVLALPSTSFPS